MRRLDLSNQKFHKLTAVSPTKLNNRTAWNCQCECGNLVIISSNHLMSSHTKSCGCLNYEKNILKCSKMNEAVRLYTPELSSARRVWKKRYNDGNLTFDDFLNLSQQKCYYCGAEPNNVMNVAKHDKKSSEIAKETGDFIYNGLDRIDSNLPHNLDNIVTCCKYCNYAKRERNLEDFKIWIKNIYQHTIGSI